MEDLAILILLFLFGGVGSGAPKEEEKKGNGKTGNGGTGNGGTKPKQGVAGDFGELKPVPKKVIPANLPVPTGKIKISPDCKTATLEPGWEDSIRPMVEAAVAAGAGLPVYAPQTAAKSVDAVIRTVVNAQTGNACINSAPWLDRWATQNPIPTLSQGESASDYFAKLAAWDNAWDQTIATWAQAHPQAFDVFKQIGSYIASRWAGEVGYVPRQPGAPGPSQDVKSIPSSKRTADTNMLRTLGYDIHPAVTEEFQDDFNLVMDYRTNFGWTKFGKQLAADNKFGPLTRAAAGEALSLTGGNPNRWGLLLTTAREGLI